jgi:hypothetical protein
VVGNTPLSLTTLKTPCIICLRSWWRRKSPIPQHIKICKPFKASTLQQKRLGRGMVCSYFLNCGGQSRSIALHWSRSVSLLLVALRWVDHLSVAWHQRTECTCRSHFTFTQVKPIRPMLKTLEAFTYSGSSRRSCWLPTQTLAKNGGSWC